MPFTDKAKREMLIWMFCGSPLQVGISDRDQLFPGTQIVSFRWDSAMNTIVNQDEVIFPRLTLDSDKPYETWTLYDATGDLLAYDKLERPILLRKGERATFPPGALRLELK